MLQMDRLTKIALMLLVTNMTKVQKPDYVLQMNKLGKPSKKKTKKVWEFSKPGGGGGLTQIQTFFWIFLGFF